MYAVHIELLESNDNESKCLNSDTVFNLSKEEALSLFEDVQNELQK
jgi:hypothetical protein